jgi:predicted Zn finger-like uncharacterized protein
MPKSTGILTAFTRSFEYKSAVRNDRNLIGRERMIIQCPKCKTKYRVDDELISPEGKPVRCSRCKEVFEVTLDEPTTNPPVSSGGDGPLSSPGQGLGEDDDFLGLAVRSNPAERSPSVPVVDNEDQLHDDSSPEEEGVSITERLGLGDDHAHVQDPEREEERPGQDTAVPRKRSRTAVLLLVLSLLLIAAGTYYFYPQIRPYLPEWVTQRINTTTGDLGLLQKNEQGSGVENITLVDVRQYFVANDKIGQLFVIEGRAVNGYSGPKELIKIQASLYDGEGNVLESKQFLCGNTVSLFQLQVLSKEELESALNSKVGVLTNNTNLQPGAEVPFMTVFPNPPENVQEFGAKVIDIKDLSRK